MKLNAALLIMLAVTMGLRSPLALAQDPKTAEKPADAVAPPPAAAEPPAPSEVKAPGAPEGEAPAKAGAATSGDSEYEIDYEEEPGSEGDDAAEEPPPAKHAKGKKQVYAPGGGAGGIMGSRAKHRFTPILKSETKSIYKKDGKALDVDSD